MRIVTALLVLGWVVGAGVGCTDRGSPPGDAPRSSQPLPTERLHPPGELRLTSAGETPRLKLRYRLAEGQRQGYRTWLASTHSAAGQTTRLSTEFDWEREVSAVQGDQATVTTRMRRVRFVRPTTIRDLVTPTLRKLTLTLHLDSRGRVRKLDPKGTLPGFQGAGALSRFTAPLPADAVGHGATWERSERWPLVLPKSRQRVTLGVRTRYRLTLTRHKGAPRRATLTASLRLTTATQGPGALTGQRVTGGGKGTAELTLDLVRGELTGGKSAQSLKLTVVGYGRTQALEQSLRTRTRAIRLKPPRPKGPMAP